MRKYQSGNFTSKLDGANHSKKFHLCVNCLYFANAKWDICPICKVSGKTSSKDNNRLFFPSKSEYKRALELLFLEKNRVIKNLEFHKRFELSVNNHKICDYECDSTYYDCEKNIQIIEDVKPKNSEFMFELAKFKIELFKAIYCNENNNIEFNIYR